MQNFFLVLDTETSGVPKNWFSSYADQKNWPYIVQIAWVIYDLEYQEVKRENHYIKNTDIKIQKAALQIHNITPEYLQAHGEDKKQVMLKFYADIIKYNPLLIGHFIEFDYHMINVELFRIGKENVLQNIPLFCTMKASAPYVKNPIFSELKLDRFYKTLFNKEPDNLHNALSDALNTAKIFFYLLSTGKLSKTDIYNQQNTLENKIPLEKNKTSTIKKILSLLFLTAFFNGG